MRVFIFTHNRAEKITTSRALTDCGIDHVVLTHNQEQRELYINAGRVPKDSVVSADVPLGLSNLRNAALEMMVDDEWALFLVDDYKVTRILDDYSVYSGADEVPVNTSNTTAWNRKFRNHASIADLFDKAIETSKMCDMVGAKLGGFAAYSNPLFRKRKWKFNGFVDGRAWVIRKSHLRFDTNVQAIDDFAFSILNLKTFGKTVVNTWVLPDFNRYSPPKNGRIDGRMARQILDCAYLVKTYPEIVVYRDKKHWPAGSHIAIKPVYKSKRVDWSKI